MREHKEYGDDEAERIIERAAEIDAQNRRMVDAASIRSIAAKAGISPDAVDRALEEHDTPAGTGTPPLKRFRIGLMLVAIAAGLLIFALMRTVPRFPF